MLGRVNFWKFRWQATFYGHTEVVTALLEAGADPTVRAKSGCTALDLATLVDSNQVLTTSWFLTFNKSSKDLSLGTLVDSNQVSTSSQTNCIHRIIIFQKDLLAHIFTRSAKCCDYWLPILLVRITIAFQAKFHNQFNPEGIHYGAKCSA